MMSTVINHFPFPVAGAHRLPSIPGGIGGLE
jgi:hypothetical protein